VVAKGDSLFETLMLNLTLLKDGMELWGEAKPSWEREKPSEEKLKEVPVPDNQPEILTLQCRRLILHRENGIVTGYTEAAGEYIEKESAYSEQMTFWTIRKKGKNVEQYYPKMHDKSRQMWRDFSVLLGNSGRKPGVVSWVSLLQSKGIFPKNRFVTFKIVGVEYGSMTCGIVDEFSDSLEFHASLLDEIGVVWQQHICAEIVRCDQLASVVGCLGQNLDKAVGGDGKSTKENAKEQAYYRLDIPFRQWLIQVEPNQDLEKQNEYRANWRKISKDIIKNFGRELVEQAGSAAVVGRVVKEKIKNKDVEKHYSAPEAFNYFLYQLEMVDKQGVRI
jgi:CRISPR system Cascade subunit CasA